jgi:predicted nucleotidyltransferase
MRLHDPLDYIWNSAVKTRLLRVLYRTGGGLTGRRIAGLVGYSHTHTMATLADLEAQGLVNMIRAGNSYMFSINMKNEIVKGILAPAFELESELIGILADRFYDGLGKALVSVTLFGSVARREETVESDVDLLLVVKDGTDREKTENKVSEISHEVYLAFGCSIAPIVATQTEYTRKLKRKQGFWGEIPKEGRLIPPKRERASIG